MKFSFRAGNTMRYLTFLVLVVSTSLNAGAIHKWVDENGNVHYGDAPPVKTKTESVHVQSAPSNPGKALPRLSVPDGTQAAGQPEVSNEQASKICEAARNDLNVINTSNRVRMKQADGTLRYLSEEEIAKRKADSEAEVARYCK
jgi:hypothetical protein